MNQKKLFNRGTGLFLILVLLSSPVSAAPLAGAEQKIPSYAVNPVTPRQTNTALPTTKEEAENVQENAKHSAPLVGISDDFFSSEESPLFGDVEPTPPPELGLGEGGVEGMGWLMAKVVLFLIFLSGLAYAVYRLSGRRSLRLSGSRGMVRVVGLEPIGPNRFLQVVDVAGRLLVLGVTEQNIQCLTEITDPDAVNAIRLEYGAAPVARVNHEADEKPRIKKSSQRNENKDGFIYHLQDRMRWKGLETMEHDESRIKEGTRGFLKEERDRLKRMAL